VSAIAVALIGGLTAVLAAGVPTVLTFRFQRRVHSDNQRDHDRNAKASAEQYAALRVDLLEVKAAGLDTREDVREIRDSQRNAASRLAEIETTSKLHADRLDAIDQRLPVTEATT
jgi:hypothetical protein